MKKINLVFLILLIFLFVVPTKEIKAFPFTRDLDLGMTGEDVRELQKHLNTQGFVLSPEGEPGSPGNETRMFGNATKAALQKFQASVSLPSTGYFGPLTRELVSTRYQTSIESQPPQIQQTSNISRSEIQSIISSALSNLPQSSVSYARSAPPDGLSDAIGRSLSVVNGRIDSLQNSIVAPQWSKLDSSIYYIDGNVGIGTSSPVAPFEFAKSRNGAAVFNIINDDLGTNAWAELNISNEYTPTVSGGGVGLRFHAQGRNRTTVGAFVQDSGVIEAGTALSGGLSIMARNTAGEIRFYTNGFFNERMRITSIGTIGIGTTTPSARLSLTQSANTSAGGLWIANSNNTDFRSMFIDTNGVMSFYGGDTAGTLNIATLNAAGEWTNASDLAYKEDIQTLSYGLEDVMELEPRSYLLKATNNKRIGFIAQEMESVIPEVVSGEEGSKGISYGNLTAVIVKAVQELWQKVEPITKWFEGGDLKVQGNVCVDEVCVTKDQFKDLLLRSGVGAVQITTSNNQTLDTSEQKNDSQDTASTTPIIIELVATSTSPTLEQIATSTPYISPEEIATSTSER